ncbi:tetratricopeptide repeat protein [Frateuria sp. MAH-13]|uniref:Tetratricopeptide repeat protein n=1 Tax=Frateuria flava TaxID=2821489 RepID=A0ABS4DNJ4_9GAMM|nr:tetratricopeptide repeat protein [Frateuria flava]MBP1474601.1 tetratricopeptide repeat protein [Frateuria flava]
MNRTESGARDGGATPYRFGDVVVDPAAQTLSRAGVPQPVEPKAFAVLLALLHHPGELIGRDDLIDQVWGHRHVTPGVLTRAIAQLRHALGEDPQQPRYIQTRHALGYRFIGQLQDPPAPRPPDATAPPPYDTMPAAHEPAVPEPAGLPPPAAVVPAWSTVDPPVHGHRPGAWRWPSLAGLVLLGVLAAWGVLQWRATMHRPVAASVAVLPFANLSGNAHDDYFAEGLAEEMRDALAGVKGLKVVASVPSVPDSQAVDTQALGQRLGVASILGASVRREGSRVRITARLTDTSTGFVLWSHTYDRQLTGIFDTQSDIAREVVHALLGAIPDGGEQLARRLAPTHNAAAFDTYLAGLQLLNRATTEPEAADRAIARFGQALQQDSQFARAQAGICRAEIWRFQSSHNPSAFDNAKAACQRAAQMDPSMPETDQALGDLYRASGDGARALEHYRKSARSPALAAASHVGMAKVYAAQGRSDLALAQFQRALELSPDDAGVHAELGYQQYLDGKVPQAVSSYRRAVELQPDREDLWETLGALYIEAGDDTAAQAALERAIGIEPTVGAVTNLGLLKYQHGDYAAAVALQRQATTLGPDDFMVWGNLGEALRVDPASSKADMRKAFDEAAERAERYLVVEPRDARAVAALAFYRVMLGDRIRARELVVRAEALHAQPGEVALLNAETLALLGDLDGARQRLATARAAGIPETLIASNHTFRQLGLLSPPATARPGGRKPPAPHSRAGASAGE